MSHYKKHLFFCVNQKAEGKPCCQNAGAKDMFAYAKQLIQEKGMWGEGQVRVSHSGCLGRCKIGPCIVIYPEQIWYTYESREDINEIIEKHVIGGEVVERLLM